MTRLACGNAVIRGNSGSIDFCAYESRMTLEAGGVSNS